MHGLELFEALFDLGLTLVGLQDLGGGEAALVGNQRVLPRVPDHAASGHVPAKQPGALGSAASHVSA